MRQTSVAMASAALVAVLLTGCAGPEFQATAAKAQPIAEKLRAAFNLDGYSPGAVDGGYWGPDSGGDPNFGFTAVHKSDKIDAPAQCALVTDYFFSLSSSKPVTNSGQHINRDQATAACIGELLSEYMSGFTLTGTYEKAPVTIHFSADKVGLPGETTSEPVSYELNIATIFEQGTSGLAGCPECLMVDPIDPGLSKYLNTVQDFRVKKGVELLTPELILESGAVAKTATSTMTPVADSDGKVTRLKVEYSNQSGLMPQCYSLLPWNKKYWGIDDPGSPRPLMFMASLDNLNSFGQFVSNSDCVNDQVN